MTVIYCLIGACVFFSFIAVFANLVLRARIEEIREELKHINYNLRIEGELRKDYVTIIWDLKDRTEELERWKSVQVKKKLKKIKKNHKK